MKKICSQKGIKNYSSKKKKDLFNLLLMESKVRKIQTWFRTFYCTNICPISLSSITFPFYCFKPTNSNRIIYYNLECLTNYLISSGDFRDPFSREIYSVAFIKALDKYKKNIKGIDKRNLFNIKKKKEKNYRLEKDREAVLLVIDLSIDGIMIEIRNMMENYTTREEELNRSINLLKNYYFKLFVNYIVRMISSSVITAKQKLNQSILIIKRNIDYNNLKESILKFLNTIKENYF